MTCDRPDEEVNARDWRGRKDDDNDSDDGPEYDVQV